jgi:hypothetical protein
LEGGPYQYPRIQVPEEDLRQQQQATNITPPIDNQNPLEEERHKEGEPTSQPGEKEYYCRVWCHSKIRLLSNPGLLALGRRRRINGR